MTIVIAIVVTYIAWQQAYIAGQQKQIAGQQWQTNRQKLIHDLYDRRIRIYREVFEFVSIIDREAKVSTENLRKFRTSVAEAVFLFRPEVISYIDEIYKHCVTFRRLSNQPRDATEQTPAYDDTEGLKWFTEQYDCMQRVFMKDLNISEQYDLNINEQYALMKHPFMKYPNINEQYELMKQCLVKYLKFRK